MKDQDKADDATMTALAYQHKLGKNLSVYGLWADGTDGGLRILGLIKAADEPGIHLAAVMSEVTPTDYPMKFSVAKQATTTWSPFSGGRLGFAWDNDTQ